MSGEEHQLLPDDQAFDRGPAFQAGEMGFMVNEDDFQCIDMDAPRSSKAFVSQPASPLMPSPVNEKLPVGAQSKRRFRKRSVNLHPLPDGQLDVVRASFDKVDIDNTGYISQESLKVMLKSN